MYGLLLENLAEYIRTAYGEDKWEEVRRLAHVDMPTFSTRRVYSDSVIPRLAHKATKVLGVSEKDFFQAMGEFFIEFVGQYGYDRVMSVLGRHMRDFLNGLDNLHEYLKFSYPRMKAPSFICENENEYGLTLHYRSKRQGYVYYTMGQIRAVGRHFYSTDVRIELVHEELQLDTVHVTFQLYFENTAYLEMNRASQAMDKLFPVQPALFLDIFPFSVVFGHDMVISNIGHSLEVVLPNLLGSKITDSFNLNRPLIDFNWPTVLIRTNNIFELVTMEPLHRSRSYELLMKAKMAEEGIESGDEELDMLDDDSFSSCLSLKGQMLYMEDWSSIIFLGTPIMQDLEAMMKVGLYINDLSMHDFSRDLMLAGTQQSVELKLALDQEQQKSKRLEDSMKKLDDEMRRTDELLYQMIPKAVADRLRKGAEAVTTCEVFECVTILFSDVVTFTQICSRITPMEVVSLLNSMYSVFDQLTSKHDIYKVETIGDAYMVVSGAPEKRRNHADKICAMALDMRTGIAGIQDPSTGINISIRIGIHSGTVVAGVVGLKMPRYCLFGDTVNTASRMESTSEPMKIHVSESTTELLHRELYEIVERGVVTVKGKGEMKTYFLVSRLGPMLELSEDENAADAAAAAAAAAAARNVSNPVDMPTRESSPDERYSPSVRSLYSPVTLDDVVRAKMASPFRQHSNSWNGTNQPVPPPPQPQQPPAGQRAIDAPPAAGQAKESGGNRGVQGRGAGAKTGRWVLAAKAAAAPVPSAPPPAVTVPPIGKPQDSKKVASSQQKAPVGRSTDVDQTRKGGGGAAGGTAAAAGGGGGGGGQRDREKERRDTYQERRDNQRNIAPTAPPPAPPPASIQRDSNPADRDIQQNTVPPPADPDSQRDTDRRNWDTRWGIDQATAQRNVDEQRDGRDTWPPPGERPSNRDLNQSGPGAQRDDGSKPRKDTGWNWNENQPPLTDGRVLELPPQMNPLPQNDVRGMNQLPQFVGRQLDQLPRNVGREQELPPRNFGRDPDQLPWSAGRQVDQPRWNVGQEREFPQRNAGQEQEFPQRNAGREQVFFPRNVAREQDLPPRNAGWELDQSRDDSAYRNRYPDGGWRREDGMIVRWQDQQQDLYRLPDSDSRYTEWRRVSRRNDSVPDRAPPPPERAPRMPLSTVAGLFPCLSRMVAPSESWPPPRTLADGYEPTENFRNQVGGGGGGRRGEDIDYRYVNSTSDRAVPLRQKLNGVRSNYCVLL